MDSEVPYCVPLVPVDCDWAAMERELCSGPSTADEARRCGLSFGRDPEFARFRPTPPQELKSSRPKTLGDLLVERSILVPLDRERKPTYVKRDYSLSQGRDPPGILTKADEVAGEWLDSYVKPPPPATYTRYKYEFPGEEGGSGFLKDSQPLLDFEPFLGEREPEEEGEAECVDSEDEEEDLEVDSDEELILTEEELRFLVLELPARKWEATFCLQRILSLLLEPDLKGPESEARVMTLWKFYVRRSPNGVFLPDIKLLMDIAVVLEDRFRRKCFAVKLVQRILAHYQQGIRIRRMTDKAYLHQLASLFNTIGQVLVTRDKAGVYNALRILYSLPKSNQRTVSRGQGHDPDSCDLPLSRTDFWLAMDSSWLPEVLLRRIGDGETGAHDLWLDLLSFLSQLTEYSKRGSRLAAKVPFIEVLLRKLKGRRDDTKLLSRTCRVLYNVLMDPSAECSNMSPCSFSAFQGLLKRFTERTQTISSKYLRNLRNDVGFVILLLVKNLPGLRTGFGAYADFIAGTVSRSIFGRASDSIVLDGTPEDFEFLTTLLWILRSILEHDVQAKALLKDHQLIPVFMRLLMGPCDLVDRFSETGDSGALDCLLNVTWACLSVVAHQFPVHLQEPEGIDAMMSVLQIYAEHGRTDLSLVSLFLDTARVLLRQKDPGMLEYFEARDGMETFTKVLKQLTKTDWAMSEEPTIANVLLACSAMANLDERQPEVFRENDGVKILLRLINRLVYAPAHKRHMSSVLHVALADCIWATVADSPSGLETFLAFEGMFRILDLLELSSGPGAQLHLLSAILELAEYPRCVDQMLYWKRTLRNQVNREAHGDGFQLPEARYAGRPKPVPGDNIGELIVDQDLSLPALLCDIWREEETRLGVKRDKEGVIASIVEPLKSSFARAYKRRVNRGLSKPELGNEAEVNVNGPAALDLINSVRPKIFLLVKRLTESTNTEATAFGGLSLRNQVTMQIIINMLDLKRGEIWVEMAESLRQEGIRLVESDEAALGSYFKVSQNKVAVVIETQRYLIRRARENAELQERELYTALQQTHLQDHLKALREAEYFARTSNYFLLMDKRLWQKAQLQRALQNIDSNARVHRTTEDTLNVTAWPAGRNRFIDSEPQFSGVGFDEAANRAEAEKYLDTTELDGEGGERRHKYHFRSVNTLGTQFALLLPSQMDSPNDTPEPASANEAFYEIDPRLLQKALLNYLKEQRKWNWKDSDPESGWSVRTKWKSNWYH